MTPEQQHQMRLHILNMYYGDPSGFIQSFFEENRKHFSIDIGGICKGKSLVTVNIKQ